MRHAMSNAHTLDGSERCQSSPDPISHYAGKKLIASCSARTGQLSAQLIRITPGWTIPLEFYVN
jgi:hypothetical protein